MTIVFVMKQYHLIAMSQAVLYALKHEKLVDDMV
jgi:hypothetical protein